MGKEILFRTFNIVSVLICLVTIEVFAQPEISPPSLPDIDTILRADQKAALDRGESENTSFPKGTSPIAAITAEALHSASTEKVRKDTGLNITQIKDVKLNRNVNVKVDEILVKFKKDSKKSAQDEALTRRKAIKSPRKSKSLEKIRFHRVRVPEGKNLNDFLEDIREDPAVEIAEPNVLLRSCGVTTNDPLYDQQWGLKAIHAPEAWEITEGDPSIVVAVIDSGVDLDHPDLMANLVSGYNFIDDTENADDDFGHGTQVASIIAAIKDNGIGIAGVAPRCRVMPLKVLDTNGEGTAADVAEAIIHATDYGCRVINLSLGTYAWSDAIKDAVDYADTQNCALVAAAGNNGTTMPCYPAAFPETLAVAATDKNSNAACFSNKGDYIDVAAPGVSIQSLALNDGNSTITGTSAASSFVSGLSAILVSQHPEFNNSKVQAAIVAHCRNADNRGWISDVGMGVINCPRTVCAKTVSERDIGIASLKVIPPQPLPGLPTNVYVKVRNHGLIDSDETIISLHEDDDLFDTLNISPLTSKKVQEYIFTWNPIQNEINSTIIETKVQESIKETHLLDNTRYKTVNYAEQAYHDIAITDIKLNQPELSINDKLEIIVSVTNNGHYDEKYTNISLSVSDLFSEVVSKTINISYTENKEVLFVIDPSEIFNEKEIKYLNIIAACKISNTENIVDNNNKELTLNITHLDETSVSILPLYSVDTPVHQWIAFQAYNKLPSSDLKDEIAEYLPTLSTSEYYQSDFSIPSGWWDTNRNDPYIKSTALIEGAWEEDKDSLYTSPFGHFWDPDSAYNAGLTDYYSCLMSIQDRFTKAVDNYNAGNEIDAYYWLGRSAHLMADMAVPSHVQLDTHLNFFPILDSDNYEGFIADYDHYKHINSSSSNTSIPSYSNPPGINYPGINDIPSSLGYNDDLTNLLYSLANFTDNYDSDGDSALLWFGDGDETNGKYNRAYTQVDHNKTVYYVVARNYAPPYSETWLSNGTHWNAIKCEWSRDACVAYTPTCYEKYNNSILSYIRIYFTDGTFQNDQNWNEYDVPWAVCGEIYQPQLQARAIGYTAALYQLFWDKTHPNQPPNPPTEPTPSDGAIDVSVIANLDWSCTDPDNDTRYYTVWLSKDNNIFSDSERIKIDSTGSSADPGTMDYGAHYYWKVVADDHISGTSSAEWDFWTELELVPPTLQGIVINGGASTTTSRAVTLNITSTGDPTHYIASESNNFTGATWETYSSTPSFTLSIGNGFKDVYVKLKNSIGESNTKFDSITLDEPYPPIVDIFLINEGASSTNSQTVILNNTCSYGPTHYMASDSASFSGSTWQPYSTSPEFVLSAGEGQKQVYFKVKNDDGESSVTSDTILYTPQGKLQFESSYKSISENGGSIRIYVNRIEGTNGNITVGYTTTNESAIAGEDYTEQSGTLTWDNGDGLDKYFDVPILLDSNNEDREMLKAMLISPYDAILGTPSTLFVEILDIDSQVDSLYVDIDNTTGPWDGETWATAFNTIQGGIDAAVQSGGGKIWVAEGTYPESILLGSNVSVYGGFSGVESAFSERDFEVNICTIDASTVASGNSADHVVIMDSITNCKFDGFTITGGGHESNYGGGFYCSNVGGESVIINCVIRENTAIDGGGIFLENSDFPSIINCSINNNSVTNSGGGVFCVSALPVISNCIIADNLSGYDAGGLSCFNSSSPQVTNCMIINNSANNKGGGIRCYDSSSPSFIDCTISANISGGDGGGLHLMYSDPLFISSSITNNSAVGFGGGIYTEYSSPKITNCIISANSVDEFGGALFHNTGLPKITNCTINGNTATRGGGIYCEQDPQPFISNTIFTNNSNLAICEMLFSEYKTDISAVNCLFYNNPNGDWYDDDTGLNYTGAAAINANIPEATNNIEGDPFYRNLFSNDYFLLQNSACIDAGNNRYVPDGISTDFSGNPRFIDDPETSDAGVGIPPIIDVGAYEFQVESVLPSGYVQFSSSTYTVSEDAESIRIYVSRTGGFYGLVTVNYQTANGSAGEVSDYTATSGSLSWVDGDMEDKYFDVLITDDTTPEDAETFFVRLSSVNNVSLGSPFQTVVTINGPNDQPPVIIEHPTSQLVKLGDEVTLSVTASGTSPLSYQWRKGGVDIPGENSSTYVINSVESHDVGIYDCIITNDYGEAITNIASLSMGSGIVQFTSPSYRVDEDTESIRVYVSRTEGSFGEISVNYLAVDNSAVSGQDYLVQSGQLTWADSDMSARFIDISITNDTIPENPEIFTIILNDTNSNSSVTATVHILDDDPKNTILVDAKNTSGPWNGLSWNTAFVKIQDGINAAELAGGGHVWVANGTYLETITLANNVHLYGGFSGTETLLSERDFELNPTTIDGSTVELEQPVGPVVVMDHIVGSRIDSFVITGGNGNAPYPDNRGGGVDCVNIDETNTISNCIIIENLGYGGAGICCSSSSPLIIDCTIKNNTAGPAGGGGIRCSFDNCVPRILDCRILDNSTSSNGGGIVTFDSNPIINNCTISNNIGNSGGGISGGEPVIINCVISNNTARYNGGGIGDIRGGSIINCTISGNSAANTPFRGGGVFVAGTGNIYNTMTIANTVFHGNNRYSIWEEGAGADPNVTNCLFFNNIDGDYYDNDSGTGYVGSNAINTNIPEASFNIDTNLLFLDIFSEDFKILANSPCIDAGNNTVVPADISTDLTGNSRFIDVVEIIDTGIGMSPIVDIGAYEYQDEGIIEPPHILNDPVTQTVNPGDEVVFTISAEGKSLHYQWRKNAIEISEENSSSYVISVVEEVDEGSYDCAVSNSADTVISNAAILSVNDPPVITSHPISQSVDPGDTINLSVMTSGTEPIAYQWRKDGETILGAVSASFEILDCFESDEGDYDCVVTNSAGTTTSSVATITVNDPPEVSNHPSGVTVNPGDLVTFTVTATGTSPLNYQWRKDGTAISGAETNIYEITSVQESDEGSYDCVVSNSADTVISNAATLSVNDPVIITVHPENQIVEEGSPVNFTVSASGTAPIQYQWRKDTVEISGANDSSYDIASASADDEGEFDCVVTNIVRSQISNTAILTVNTNPDTPETFFVDLLNESGIEDGSSQFPYTSISKAIAETVSDRGDTILVLPGEYSESVQLSPGTSLISIHGSYHTWINGPTAQSAVVTLASNCVLRGFSIFGSTQGVVTQNGSVAEITNNVIVAVDTGIAVGNSSTVNVINNTIYDCLSEGIVCNDGSTTTLENNIISNCGIGVSLLSPATILGGYNLFFENGNNYSNVQAAVTDFSSDPLFVDSTIYNFHLAYNSPCRDGGHPDIAYNDLDTSRNDIGADGGPYGVWDQLAPLAVALAIPESGDAPLTVTLDGTGSKDEWGLATYYWDVDSADGLQNDLSGEIAEYTYQIPGEYEVTLMVTDNSELEASNTVQVIVGSVPDVSASATPIAGLPPLMVTFDGEGSDPDGGVVSFYWDFGDGEESFEEDPVHSYPAVTPPWTYTATLYVTDDENVTSSDKVYITITEGDMSPEAAELVFPISGATINIDDPDSPLEGITIDVPSDAISEPVVITISTVDSSLPQPENAFGLMVEFGPSGTVFSVPVTVSIPHASDTLHEEELQVFCYDSGTDSWIEDGISNVRHIEDDLNHFVQFEVTHFTTFAVVSSGEEDDDNDNDKIPFSCSGKINEINYIIDNFYGDILLIILLILVLCFSKNRRKKI